MPILTERLELIAATPELLATAQTGDAALASALHAALPPSWPPEFYGPQSLEFTLERLAQGPEQADWWLRWFVLREPRTLIGYGGCKGPPTADGTIEVGYAIVDDHQRKGYATEITAALIEDARHRAPVRRAIAETMPDRTASIRVLEKLGFRLLGPSAEEGVVLYELRFESPAPGRIPAGMQPR